MDLIKFNDIKSEINKILSEKYPIKINKKELLDNLQNLSHFFIMSFNWNKFLPYNIDINGNILIKNNISDDKVFNVITSNKKYTWNEYINTLTFFIRKCDNYCINKDNFIQYLHVYNYIDILHIISFDIYNSNTRNVMNISIKYGKNQYYSINSTNKLLHSKINNSNHFYLNSFNVYKNYKNLKNELMRLFINRDKYKSIHFHLDDNFGGDIVPAHLIIRCLVGKKEKWMKNIKKYLTNKKILEWNCWKEENIHSPNYEVVKKLNLDFIPEYKTKYSGKIYLYMNNYNGSSAWFFITYLIYAFSNKIIRFRKKCYGSWLKFGKVSTNTQLVIKGISGTTSGDGNSININIKNNKNIIVTCPTEQFISCSIKKKDWNRFWVENN